MTTRVDYTTEGFDKDALVPLSAQTPVCRTCYLRSLPAEQAARIAAEPITTPIYYCPEHEERAREISRIFEDAVEKGVIHINSTPTGRLSFPPYHPASRAWVG